MPADADDEASRIDTLHALDILDTSSEERFDRLTRLASLVDENRQWLKSCQGLDMSETSRDISFCGHAILNDGIFLIPDAARKNK